MPSMMPPCRPRGRPPPSGLAENDDPEKSGDACTIRDWLSLAMWSAPPLAPFEELQRTFAARYPASDPLDLGEGTVVVLPSLSFPTAELRKIVGIGYYEERLLFLLLLLRRPELLDRVRELCEGPGGAFVQPFNVTASEQELSERLGLPLYGPPAALASLGSKTGSRRVARLAGVPVLDGAEDLRSVEAVEAAAPRLGERPGPPLGSGVIQLNDGFFRPGHALGELGGLH